jgi:hypothetical protein
MRCRHKKYGCGLKFDYFNTAACYKKEAGDDFRGVLCWHCGRPGADRIWEGSAPVVKSCQGQWGQTATPGLKGQTFWSKEERDAQTAAVGTRVIEDDGDNEGDLGPRSSRRRIIRNGKLIDAPAKTRPPATYLRPPYESVARALTSGSSKRVKALAADSGVREEDVRTVLRVHDWFEFSRGWAKLNEAGLSAAQQLT